MSRESSVLLSRRSWLPASVCLGIALLGVALIALSVLGRGEGAGPPPFPEGFAPEARLFKGHTGPVHNLQFASNQRLVSGSGWPQGDQTVRVWDLATGQEQGRIAVWGTVHALDLSSDGRFAVVGLNNGMIQYLDLDKGKILRSLKIHGGAVGWVAFAADGTRGASTSDEGTARVWDLAEGKVLASFTVPSKRARCGAVLPGGRQLLTGDSKGLLQIWDVAAQKELRRIQMGGPWMLDAIRLTGDGSKALVAGVAGTRVHDLATGDEVGRFQENAEEHHSAALSAGDRWLLTGGMDGKVRLWDFKNGDLLVVLGSHKNYAFSVAFSPDGRLAASGGGGENRNGKFVAGTDHDIRVWTLPPLPADSSPRRRAAGGALTILGALLLVGAVVGFGIWSYTRSRRGAT